jgi:hypothetical protein
MHHFFGFEALAVDNAGGFHRHPHKSEFPIKRSGVDDCRRSRLEAHRMVSLRYAHAQLN